MENACIEHLRRSTEAIAQQYRFGDLEEEYIKIVEELYDKRNPLSLKGAEAK